MQSSVKVSRRDVAAIVAATFPDYRGRKISVEPCETVRVHDLHWSGGSCREYVAATLAGRRLGGLEHIHRLAPWDGRAVAAEGASVPVPPGACLVEHVIFCGRDLGLRIYVHPSDMPRLLARP